MIYVLVPAHNEAPTIGLLLWKVRQVFTGFEREYQLLLANDGSTDATEDVLAPYIRALPLTVVTHRERRGYAQSLEVLLRLAVARSDRPRRDLAVTLPADFQDPPEAIPELVRHIEGGADIVVTDARRRSDLPPLELLARRLCSALIRRDIKIPGVQDYTSRLRAFRLATLARLFREAGERTCLAQEGWAADVELLLLASRHARTLESVAITDRPALRHAPSWTPPIHAAWQAWRAARALGRARGFPSPA